MTMFPKSTNQTLTLLKASRVFSVFYVHRRTRWRRQDFTMLQSVATRCHEVVVIHYFIALRVVVFKLAEVMTTC